jgi:hypothetical protein
MNISRREGGKGGQESAARAAGTRGQGGSWMTSLSQIDLIVVIVYAIGIFGLAQWVSREKAGTPKIRRIISSPQNPCLGGRSARR